ncbi:DUF4310 family protein [Streptomyces sp. NPDC057460]|uniref:DUF4310 family protein n=1 Tax=Streptomyces sp. NPDC057460 TaxID=3346141 RepID=UPI00367871A0
MPSRRRQPGSGSLARASAPFRRHPRRRTCRRRAASGSSTFGADGMMGAGNSAGRYLGPLIIIAAATASLPVGIGSTIGALLFHLWKKPRTGGAILGAMLFGVILPIPGS